MKNLEAGKRSFEDDPEKRKQTVQNAVLRKIAGGRGFLPNVRSSDSVKINEPKESLAVDKFKD